MVNERWNIFIFKDDLISLYEILCKINKLIYNKFNLNITDYITISSLAISIYTSNFLTKDINIPILQSQACNNIREAYYGGRVDVFEPYGENLYYYDVNSLFPFVILNDIPVGNPKYTTNPNLNELFGFVYAEIETPKNLHIPILPYKINDDLFINDDILINPLGKWKGWYFTEELKQAIEYGYKIKVLQGYIFERDNTIFKEYVELCYNQRIKSKGALKTIYKLLLNSLYGRIGINEIYEKTEIVDKNRLNELKITYAISIPPYELFENIYFVRYRIIPDKFLVELFGKNYNEILLKFDRSKRRVKQSVCLAAAITSYARIYINKFIHLPDYKVYYTDTDSIALDKPLPDEYVGENLGQFKLEYKNKLKSGLFVLPKLYILEKMDEEYISKAKTIGSDISYYEYKLLYKGVTITKHKEKWVKNIKTGNIYTKNTKIDLSYILNKRNKVYKNGIWITTSPLIIENDKIINKD